MGGGTCTSEGNYKMSEVITKQKILIADDSEMNRELLAAILEEEYDIIQANDGVTAFRGMPRRFPCFFWILLCPTWMVSRFFLI